jgi:hypothetical protein
LDTIPELRCKGKVTCCLIEKEGQVCEKLPVNIIKIGGAARLWLRAEGLKRREQSIMFLFKTRIGL